MVETKIETAVAVRTLLHFARYGTLATNSVAMPGFPFGSVTPYIINGEGCISIYISHLAEHYRNLSKDSHASLLVVDPFGHDDSQASARATVMLNFMPANAAQSGVLLKQYEARFPGSVNYQLTHDFMFMSAQPERVRWIGGFGDICWVRGEEVCAANPDCLADGAWDAIRHMNEDHQEAVELLAQKHGGLGQEKFVAAISGMTSGGVRIRVRVRNETKYVTVNFERPATPENLRAVMVELVRGARLS